MHISKIELENIKSHVFSTFEFTKGTTAITGVNGAGKTTIIEAIAWVLFDLLEYKKEDFLRRGAKKGFARITFESSLDERNYIVFRDTGTSYYVTDPRLNVRIANKKEEVFRFLWQHLGLEPGTDLRSLFRQAIGVPQGTFTAIFLEGATERKVAFDRLLKVEEYRQAAEKLRETSRFLDGRMADVRESIARAEGELSRSEAVYEEHGKYKQQTSELTNAITILEKDVAGKRLVVSKFDGIEKIDTAIANIKTDRKRVVESLETIQKAHKEIKLLRPKGAEQDKLEHEIDGLRGRIAEAKAIETQIKSLDDRIERLRESYRANSLQLKEAETKSGAASSVTPLEKRDGELVRQIAELRASLERDERFQKEIKGGLCPILSEKCLNLKQGETLESFISSQFSDIRSRISNFESEHTVVMSDLKNARDAERFASMIEGLRQRTDDLKTEGMRLTAERAGMASRTARLADLEKETSGIEARLKTLGDPRSRIHFLENETAREAEFHRMITEIESNLERLDSDRQRLIEEIDTGETETGFDRQQYTAQKAALLELEKRLAADQATLKAVKSREEQLVRELERFGELRISLAEWAKEKERLKTVAEATTFIRDTLKDAAPRVARNYVYHVSIEANQMFREIIGNAERTLKWDEDYAIMLEEDGHSRPYTSLSGGEQMAAALSVRLALLKQLTDIRIAFFDEPTANMDAERRENLAIEISRITNFDQLFIISHDETFDNFVDNVVTV